jgi:predicted RNase H-like HicB family nuclease
MDSDATRIHTPSMQFTVTVSHDEDEGVWFVQSSDIPGLHAEAKTLDELVEVVTDLAPELVAANLPDLDLRGEHSIPLRVEHVVNAPLAPAA